MKILVLGANGRTGRLVVQEALSAGFEVNALVRNGNSLEASKGLRIIEGSCEKRSVLDKALTGTGAVVVALNISRVNDFPWAKLKSPPNLISKTVETLINLMYAHGILRIITISASGVGDSSVETPGWFRWLINNSNIGIAYKDHEAQEKLVMNTDLDWTILRPVGLTNSNKLQDLKLSRKGIPKPSLTVSRKAVARFIVNELRNREHIQDVFTISGN